VFKGETKKDASDALVFLETEIYRGDSKLLASWIEAFDRRR